MKQTLILLAIIALASCSSFRRMKYRHLDKVPATPQQFSHITHPVEQSIDQVLPVANEHASQEFQHDAEPENAGVRIEKVPLLFQDSTVTVIPDVNRDSAEPGKKHAGTMRKLDWTVAIALLLIWAGLNLLGMCIFILPALGFPLVAVILLEILGLYFVWKWIGTGTVFLIKRFWRKRQNFEEK